MRSNTKDAIPLDLASIQGALAAKDQQQSLTARSHNTPRATPRLLPPLEKTSSNLTSVSERSLRRRLQHAKDAVDNVKNANNPELQQRTETRVHTPGGDQRAVSMYLSRAATKAPLHGSSRDGDAAEDDEEGEEGEGEEDDVATELPNIDKKPPGGISKEFTFTGYDIMADVPTPSPELDAEERTRKQQVDTYNEMCRQLKVIPVSFLEKKLMAREIRMRGHGLGPNGAKALAVTLVDNLNVRYLDISANEIGPEGGKAVAQMLTANVSIEEVIADDNDLGFLGGSAICLALREKEDFRKISLAGNRLRSDDGFYLADMIEHNIYLREINLSHNQLEFDGAIVIGNSLANNDTLEVLDLSWNCIRGQGALAVAYGLSRNSGLRVLNISWNGFGREGCAALAQALTVNTHLRELDLRCNRIYNEDVAVLLKGLDSNKSLSVLKLAMNPITPNGAMLIMKKLEQWEDSAIRDIDIQDIPVSSEFTDTLKQIQEKRILRVRHGIAIRHSGSPIKGDEDFGIFNTDPRALVFKLMEKENLRVIDLFHRLDDDNSFSLTRTEFKQGILMVGLPITEDQLDRIVDLMDADGDGTVDLAELMSAERQYKRAKLKKRKKAEIKAKLDAKNSAAAGDGPLGIPISRVQAKSPYGNTDPLHGSSSQRRPSKLKATALSTIATLSSMKVPR